VTYCCGGSGDDAAAKAIVKAFPHIKCTVLVDPKMIGTKLVDDGLISYVAGDMLNFIPPAQTVVLKVTISRLYIMCFAANQYFMN